MIVADVPNTVTKHMLNPHLHLTYLQLRDMTRSTEYAYSCLEMIEYDITIILSDCRPYTEDY